MSVKCELCGKEFKNTQGRRGHMTFVHHMSSSSSKSATPPATGQPPSTLEERLQKLERITGLKEPSSLDRILGTDEPITEQLEQHTHQLAELSGQLKDLSQQVKLASSSAEVLNMKKQVSQLSEQVRRHDNWLTTSRLYYILTMHSDHPAVFDDLENMRRKLEEHQPIINWVRTKFNLVEKR
jgi:small-conductance mechanosensitive channel